MKRVFFALLLGSELGEALMGRTRAALGGEQALRRSFRLPRATGLHLTLLFLGDVEETRLAPLWERVAKACADSARPHLVVDHAGSFPRRGRERVLWLGLREEPPAGRLERLCGGVLGGARRAGFDTSAEEARPFRPHVTVARPKHPSGGVPEAFYALELHEPWTPDELCLVESRRAPPEPPDYVPLERLRLRD